MSEKRDELKEQAEAEALYLEQQDRIQRLSYFEPELQLLRLSMDDAAVLDERALRQAFRARSRDLHPDAQRVAAMGKAEGELVPGAAEATIYELNQAYETLRKIVVF